MFSSLEENKAYSDIGSLLHCWLGVDRVVQAKMKFMSFLEAADGKVMERSIK